MERVRCEYSRKAIAVSIGLVCRRIADADADCAHDPHSAYPLHSESSGHAGYSVDGVDYGDRHLSAVLVARRAFGIGAVAVVLFPLACRNPALLLRPHANRETDLHSPLWSMAIEPAVVCFHPAWPELKPVKL